MFYAFFWVIPRRLNFISRRFGTLCSVFIGGYLPAYEDGTECSEKSAYKFQTPKYYPEESYKYTVIHKDGLNFVRLYFLNYTWYVNDLHNI